MSDASKLFYVCDSHQLVDGGAGVRFILSDEKQADIACFAIRYQGRVYAYVNQCQHLPVELDWNHGQFFDKDGVFLICATHGALYQPDHGRCVAGPCQGAALTALSVLERDNQIYIQR